jgi:hypothetical protein
VGDDLRQTKRQQRAEPGRDHTVAGGDRPPPAAHEEDDGEQRDEEDLALKGDEAQQILDSVVVIGEAVEELEEVEVDPSSVCGLPERHLTALFRLRHFDRCLTLVTRAAVRS